MTSSNENIRGFDPTLLTLIYDLKDQRREDLHNTPREVLVDKLLETEKYLLHVVSNSKETRYRLAITDLDAVYDDLKDDLYRYKEENR